MRIPVSEYFELLRQYLRPQSGRVLLLAVLIISGIALDIVSPQIVRRFLDAIQSGAGANDGLIVLAGAFLTAAFVRQAAVVAATALGEAVGWTATNALRRDLALHVLSLDQAFHSSTAPGVLVERIDGDVNAMASFFSQLVIKVIGNVLLLLGVLIALFLEDWRVGLALSVFAALAMALLIRLRAFAVPHHLRVRAKAAEFAGFVSERLAGMEDLRASGAVNHTLWQLKRLLREWFPLHMRANFFGSGAWLASMFLFGLGGVFALYLGGQLFLAGTITIGTVYLIFTYIELIRQPIDQIRQQIDELQRASASITRIRGLFALRSTLRTTAGPLSPMSRDAPGIDVSRANFHYADDAPVLHDVSFYLPAGQVLGVLGRTGSGKTTLARLLLRLYDLDSGEIRLRYRDRSICLDELPVATARAAIGLVTQDVQVFHATVRDNLTFFDASVSDARIKQALVDLGLGPWLSRLPYGIHTILKGDGAGLSAGEAQLLAFARMFLREPAVVVMDEASSRMDPATEQMLEVATVRLLDKRTGVIIAHRLATLQRADQILIMDGGRVLEFGPRATLAADPDSRFSQLLRAGIDEVLS